MRDIGPVFKERKKIVKRVGRAEKKAGGLGGGFESKSVYKVMVMEEAGGRKDRNQNTKKFYSDFLLMVENVRYISLLCFFPKFLLCFFVCLFLFSVSLLYYSYLCNNLVFNIKQ